MENNDNQPLVSVVMASFNEPRSIINQAIESILKQTYINLELIIADDSTLVETRKVIDQAAAADHRVRVIRQEQRMGFVAALNQGLRAAKGKLIARMDSDDISLPNRIQLQVDYAMTHPEITIFGGSIYIINADNQIISERIYPTTFRKMYRMFLFRNPMAHPTIMFRREIIEKGYFYNTDYPQSEDLELYLRLFQDGYKMGNLDKHLVKYRVIGNMTDKRTKTNWIYNHKARTRFIKAKPVFSIVSFLISSSYQYIPRKIIDYFYRRDNEKFLHQPSAQQ